MNDLFKILTSVKGLTTYRGLTLAMLLYVAYAVTRLEARVAVLESRVKPFAVLSR